MSGHGVTPIYQKYQSFYTDIQAGSMMYCRFQIYWDDSHYNNTTDDTDFISYFDPQIMMYTGVRNNNRSPLDMFM